MDACWGVWWCPSFLSSLVFLLLHTFFASFLWILHRKKKSSPGPRLSGLLGFSVLGPHDCVIRFLVIFLVSPPVENLAPDIGHG